MAKTWKVILILFGFMLLVGILSIGVGFITGGDLERINDMFTARFNADIEYAEAVVANIESFIKGLLDLL